MAMPWEENYEEPQATSKMPWEETYEESKPQEKGFFTRLGEDYSRRNSPEVLNDLVSPDDKSQDKGFIAKMKDPYSYVTALNRVGNVAGFVGMDLPMQGLRSVYQTLIPNKVQEGISSGVNTLMSTKVPSDPYAGVAGVSTPMLSSAEVLGEAGKQYETARQEYPNIIKPAEALMNISAAVPVVKGLYGGTKGLVQGGTKYGGETVNIAKDIWSMPKIPTNPEEMASQVAANTIAKRKIVEEGLSSIGVKPRDPKQIKQFYDKATVAVDKIIENSSESISKSATPLSTAETGIKETLRKLWTRVDEATQKAGDNVFENTHLKNAIDELLDPQGADYKTLTLEETSLLSELKRKQKLLGEAEPSSASQLQNLMQSYNEGAQKRDFSKFTQRVNAKLHLATGADLEKGLAELGIKGRPEFLKEYGAVREIQDGIAKKAASALGKMDISYLDILNASAAAHGLIMARPELLMGAVLTESVRLGVKELKNPNRIVRNVFKKVEAINDNTRFNPKSKYFKNKIAPKERPPINPLEGDISGAYRPPLRIESGGWEQGRATPIDGAPIDFMDVPFTSTPQRAIRGFDQPLQLPAQTFENPNFTMPQGTPYLPQQVNPIRLPQGGVPEQGLMEQGRITQGNNLRSATQVANSSTPEAIKLQQVENIPSNPAKTELPSVEPVKLETKLNEVAKAPVVEVTKPVVKETAKQEIKRLDNLSEQKPDFLIGKEFDEGYSNSNKFDDRLATTLLNRFMKATPEFKDAPVFKVVGEGKDAVLQFKDSYRFRFLPEVFNIDRTILKDGQLVKLDMDSWFNKGAKGEEYFINMKDGQWKKVKGFKVNIPGFEDADVFYTKSGGYINFNEGKSGASIGRAYTKNLKDAIEHISGIMEGKPLQKEVAAMIEKTGLSPKHMDKTQKKNFLSEQKLAQFKDIEEPTIDTVGLRDTKRKFK
jgi:hypothetical protein